MPSLAVLTAVETRLDALFTRSDRPRTELNTLGELVPPKNKSAFYAVTTWVSTEKADSVGQPSARQMEETGAFHIVCFVPIATGIITAATWLEDLKTVFRTWGNGPLKNIAFGADGITGSALNGSYFEASLTVSYNYYFIG